MVVFSIDDGLSMVVVVSQGIEGADGLKQPHPEQSGDGARAEGVDEVLGVVESSLAVKDGVVLLNDEVLC